MTKVSEFNSQYFPSQVLKIGKFQASVAYKSVAYKSVACKSVAYKSVTYKIKSVYPTTSSR